MLDLLRKQHSFCWVTNSAGRRSKPEAAEGILATTFETWRVTLPKDLDPDMPEAHPRHLHFMSQQMKSFLVVFLLKSIRVGIPFLATDRILIYTRFREKYKTDVGEAFLHMYICIYNQNSPTVKNYYILFRYVSSTKAKIHGRIGEGRDRCFCLIKTNKNKRANLGWQ